MLATPDDHLVKRGKQLQSMRDNVLFEFGLFSGALGHEQAFLLIPRDSSLSLPSDLAGLLYVKYEKASAASVSRACRTISRAISSSARSRRSQIMKNARDILKSKQYRAARQLQLALKDILTIYKSLSQEVRDAASTTALRRLKEKAVKALSGIYKKHEQEIRLLGVKKEAKKLVRTLATAITKFPEFGDTETQFLALMLKSPIGNSYLTWLKSCEQQVSNAALDLNLAVTGAFDPMIIESFSPMMTSSMWQQLDRAHAMKNAHRLLLEGAKNSRAGIGKHPLNLSI
ncbi:MAG: hypothetical protein A3H49_00800 [Nitrospirae bacterium RIFCSPLOWO2_02_FULL_62_14]|nr:MAG: hypothetical protein A3H49_00800 [Nitrospirae bacterium RIFCSPLOWO2_02_FULL_62_14]OGW70265.1 MAG: hypothetical protein A3A88_05370 [Nitrospirae bacterium RIFCSPLOWO2_01_FULL_62_17]